MALVSCPECSKSISDQSISCPNCGFPFTRARTPPSLSQANIVNNELRENPQQKGYKQASGAQIIIVLVVAFFLFYFFIGSDQDEELLATVADQAVEPTSEANIEIETTAQAIINAYEANEVKADNVFKDRVIKITGVVDSIDSDFSDEAIVRLSSGEEYSFNTVDTSGNTEFHNKAITLNIGNRVTLICMGNGEIIGSPQLIDCKFS